ncbi:hypothetical protein RRG08_034491 [Elysia crispata]|uniref:Uncharacterized protein n=1 Tax=Elysia crispata TaxID=231223 RepID=A0AAE1B9U7_9GAST|nr:hypothetical protein RRG08_034491 [Elysia crispata]
MVPRPPHELCEGDTFHVLPSAQPKTMASRRLPSSERENMDLSGVIAPSTTTISTVAVQAGRSKVVLAVLRVGILNVF